MKILIIGAHGTIGKKVAAHFKSTDEVITAGRTKGDVLVDITNSESIEHMFKQCGFVDAMVVIAGEARWAELVELSEEDFYIGIRSKLMGQVNVVRLGMSYLNKGGSFTLTTGILADDPVLRTTSAAMVNGAIHSFVKAAALELKDGKRINVVSSGVVEDAYEKYKDFFPGHNPIAMDRVVNAYVRCVKGKGNGEIVRLYN